MKKQLFVGVILLHAGVLFSMDKDFVGGAMDQALSDIDASKQTPTVTQSHKAAKQAGSRAKQQARQLSQTQNGGVRKPHGTRDRKDEVKEARNAALVDLIQHNTDAWLDQLNG